MTFARMAVPCALLLVALGACLPLEQSEPVRPVVALLNAPAEDRVAGLAQILQEEVEATRRCCPFSFTRSSPVRFQETHRDLFGSRAPGQAAALARNLDAEVAVLASAPLFERTVEERDGLREVRGEVQLRALAVSAQDERQLGTVKSLVFRDARVEPLEQELPEVESDPMMQRLLREAASDLAPHLAAVLADIAATH